MVELIAAFSALNAAFNGVKAVVKTGREVEDVFKQLAKWAEAVDDLNHWLGKDTKPSIWNTTGMAVPSPMFWKLSYMGNKVLSY